MIQKTTPTLTFTVNNFNLTGYDVSIYIKQSGVNITLSPEVSIDDGVSTVVCTLTEEQTLSLGTGTAFAQIWATNGGDSVASPVIPFQVSQILNRELV